MAKQQINLHGCKDICGMLLLGTSLRGCDETNPGLVQREQEKKKKKTETSVNENRELRCKVEKEYREQKKGNMK